MIQKKICMLGSFAVGKTSLVSRFVQGIFSDRYLTTVGVKIDKREVEVGDRKVNLVLWDLAGEDEFMSVQPSYLRGTSGYLLVTDGTRRGTVEQALEIRRRHDALLGSVPGLLLVNKSDLRPEWQVSDEALSELSGAGWDLRLTSARDGTGVAEAFRALAERMLAT